MLQRGDLLLEGGVLLGNALGHVGLHLEKLGGRIVKTIVVKNKLVNVIIK